MTFQPGTYYLNIVSTRIASRLTNDQILPYLNEAAAIIGAAGSFVWDQYEELTVAVNNSTFTTFLPFDIGKKITVVNNASKTPIVRASQEEYEISAAGYLGTSTEWNTFKIWYPPAATKASIMLYPFQAALGYVDVYYHQLPVQYANLASPTSRWDVPFMDSVLLDLTEALCKRVLSWSQWEQREATAKAKLVEAVHMYSTDRINTGTTQETVMAKEEKSQIGRT